MTRRDPCLLQLKHGALLVLTLIFAVTAAPVYENDQTAIESYDGVEDGCYYNYNHYGEGDRIVTNEPCLNCTCHNRMLMCYLRVCPFTKPIGQDCIVEKREDQCCPVITCPEVPVTLDDNSSTTVSSTDIALPDNYGCSINGKFFAEGAQVPSNQNKPCELCYCIRNMTACVMQECTLHIDGCQPIYNKGVCCPVRYSCDHDTDYPPMIDDHSTTTVRPTEGFVLATPKTESQECTYNNKQFSDGAMIKTDDACKHCYCMKGDIVCAVPECGAPLEHVEKECIAQPIKKGQCCPDTFICDSETVTIPPEDPQDALQQHVIPQKTHIKGGSKVDTKRPIDEKPKDTKADKSSEEDSSEDLTTPDTLHVTEATLKETLKPHDSSEETPDASTEADKQPITTEAPESMEGEKTESPAEETTHRVLAQKPDLDERVSTEPDQTEAPASEKPDQEETTLKSEAKPDSTPEEHTTVMPEKIDLTEAPEIAAQPTTIKSIVEDEEDESSGEKMTETPATEIPEVPEKKTEIPPKVDSKVSDTEKPSLEEETTEMSKGDKVEESEETTPISQAAVVSGDTTVKSVEQVTEEQTTAEPDVEEHATTEIPIHDEKTVKSVRVSPTKKTHPSTETTLPSEEATTIASVGEKEKSTTESEDEAEKEETTLKSVRTDEIPELKPTEAPAEIEKETTAAPEQDTTEAAVDQTKPEIPTRIDDEKTEKPTSIEVETTSKPIHHEEHTTTPIEDEGTTKSVDSEETGMGKGDGVKGSAESGESTEDILPATEAPAVEDTTKIQTDEEMTTIAQASSTERVLAVTQSTKNETTSMKDSDVTQVPHVDDKLSETTEISEDDQTTVKAVLPTRARDEDEATTVEADAETSTKKPESDYAEVPSKEIVTELPSTHPEGDLPESVTLHQQPMESDSHIVGETTEKEESDETTSKSILPDETATKSVPSDETATKSIPSDESDDMNTIIPEKVTEAPHSYIPPTTIQSSDEETTERQTESPDLFPPGIPGESDCLFNGITYKNNQPIPTADEDCLESCVCFNSIVRCKSSCDLDQGVTEKSTPDEEDTTAVVVEVTKPSIEVSAIVKEIYPTEAPVEGDDKTEENEVQVDEAETTRRPILKVPISPEDEDDEQTTLKTRGEEEKHTTESQEVVTKQPEHVTLMVVPEVSTEENIIDDEDERVTTIRTAGPEIEKTEASVGVEVDTEKPVQMPEDEVVTSKPIETDSQKMPEDQEEKATTGAPEKPGLDERIDTSEEHDRTTTAVSELTTESAVTVKAVSTPEETKEAEQETTEKTSDEITTESAVTVKAVLTPEETKEAEQETTEKMSEEMATEIAVTVKAGLTTEEPKEPDHETTERISDEMATEIPVEHKPKDEKTTEEPKEPDHETTEKTSDEKATETPVEHKAKDEQTTSQAITTQPEEEQTTLKQPSEIFEEETTPKLLSEEEKLPGHAEETTLKMVEDQTTPETAIIDEVDQTTIKVLTPEIHEEATTTRMPIESQEGIQSEKETTSSPKGSEIDETHEDFTTIKPIVSDESITMEPATDELPAMTVAPEKPVEATTIVEELTTISSPAVEEALATTEKPLEEDEHPVTTKSKLKPDVEPEHDETTIAAEKEMESPGTEVPDHKAASVPTISPKEDTTTVKIEESEESEESGEGEISVTSKVDTGEQFTVRPEAPKEETTTVKIEESEESGEDELSVTSKIDAGEQITVKPELQAEKETTESIEHATEPVTAKTDEKEPEISTELPATSVTEKTEKETSVKPQQEPETKPEIMDETTQRAEEPAESTTPYEMTDETGKHTTESGDDITKAPVPVLQVEPVVETTEKEEEVAIAVTTTATPEDEKVEKPSSLDTKFSPDGDVQPETTQLPTEDSSTDKPKETEKTGTSRPSEDDETTVKAVAIEETTSKADEMEEPQTKQPDETLPTIEVTIDSDETTTKPKTEEPSTSVPVKTTEEQTTSKKVDTDDSADETTLKPSKEEEEASKPIEEEADSTTAPKVSIEDKIDIDQTTSKPEEETTDDSKTQKPFESEEETQKPTVEHDLQQVQLPVDHDETVPKEPVEEPYTTTKPGTHPETGLPASGYPDYTEDYTEEEEDPAQFGPGTCRYGGKLYVSAQQIPRDDPCDFCFCFRSDIICLQQSCPPPIQGCHEEPISGFCCPRYECHVGMATVMNITTSTTTTTTTLPPHFVNSYKGAARKSGCQIQGKAYAVGEEVSQSSGPCMRCVCGGDASMKCEPKACSPAPMLQQMIAVAAQRRR